MEGIRRLALIYFLFANLLNQKNWLVLFPTGKFMQTICLLQAKSTLSRLVEAIDRGKSVKL